MMSGICPKCHAATVYFREAVRSPSEMLTLSGEFVSKATAPDVYVCASCGYVERYVSAPEDLQTIRETWEQVAS